MVFLFRIFSYLPPVYRFLPLNTIIIALSSPATKIKHIKSDKIGQPELLNSTKFYFWGLLPLKKNTPCFTITNDIGSGKIPGRYYILWSKCKNDEMTPICCGFDIDKQAFSIYDSMDTLRRCLCLYPDFKNLHFSTIPALWPVRCLPAAATSAVPSVIIPPLFCRN